MSWLNLLDKAVIAEGSQAAVARRLGYSTSTVSRLVRGRYSGNLDEIQQKVTEIYGGKTMLEQKIPDGYMQNAMGHLVPIESIDDIDLARDEFVRELIDKARRMSAEVKQFKQQLAGDMEAFQAMSLEKYDVKTGGERGNLTLFSYDGKYQVVRAVQERINFDERLQAAKALVDECLREWSKDAGPELRTIVESAFQVDKKGQINTGRILGLRKLNITNPVWKKAMQAIGEAVTVVGSSTYYRLYERDRQGKYQQIPLDFSAV